MPIEDLLKVIEERYRFVGESIREDIYYFEDPKKRPRLRLRHLKEMQGTDAIDAWELTEKIPVGVAPDHPYEQSASAYQELTSVPEHPLKLREELLAKPTKQIKHKYKEGYLFEGDEHLSIEVWEVASIGWFLEIEVLLPHGASAEDQDAALARVQDCFAYLGFASSDWVQKPYLILIDETKCVRITRS